MTRFHKKYLFVKSKKTIRFKKRRENEFENKCFKILIEEATAYTDGTIYYEPGRLINGVFYNSPIVFKNVSILKISESEITDGVFIIELQIFDKEVYNLNLQLHKNYFRYNIKDLAKIINFLNEFLESGYSYLQLDINNFSRVNDFYSANNELIYDMVNDLKFSFKDDFVKIVGKETHYWTTITISNFPENRYLKRLIFSYFGFDDLSKTELVFTNSYCNELYYKDRLKTFLFDNFNKKEYVINEWFLIS